MKIIIISKVISGARPVPVGFDGNFSILKGTYSNNLAKNLSQKLLKEGLTSNIEVDTTFNNCTELINDGADLLLISPYIKHLIDVNDIDKKNIYFLSEKEFINTETSTIVEYIKIQNERR
ncbi:MAG: hypothetical protein ACRCYE_05700 [Sarcina sp.]